MLTDTLNLFEVQYVYVIRLHVIPLNICRWSLIGDMVQIVLTMILIFTQVMWKL